MWDISTPFAARRIRLKLVPLTVHRRPDRAPGHQPNGSAPARAPAPPAHILLIGAGAQKPAFPVRHLPSACPAPGWRRPS